MLLLLLLQAIVRQLTLFFVFPHRQSYLMYFPLHICPFAVKEKKRKEKV